MLTACVFMAANALAVPAAEPAPQPVLPVQEEMSSSSDKDGHFNYTYAQLTYGFGDLSGLTFAGSYAVSGPWIVTGSYRMWELDAGQGDVDINVFRIGGGYVHELDDGLDLVGTAEFELVDPDVNNVDSESGLFLRAGARYQVADQFEAFGGLAFRTNDDVADQSVVFDLGGRYMINDQFAAVATVEFEEETIFSIGARYDI